MYFLPSKTRKLQSTNRPKTVTFECPKTRDTGTHHVVYVSQPRGTLPLFRLFLWSFQNPFGLLRYDPGNSSSRVGTNSGSPPWSV